MATDRCQIVVRDPLGLHARPAMALVNVASEFLSQVRISSGDRSADARSITQVLLLGASAGTELEIEATGPDAHAAIKALHHVATNLTNGAFRAGAVSLGAAP